MGAAHNVPMIDLWLVRHGETDWNRELRFQGHLDAPLNPLGLQQAHRLGQHLAEHGPRPLLASDLLRTRQTAEPLAGQWQTSALPEVLWREQAFGVIEGLTLAEVHERHPQVVEQWLEHRADFALPGGGESLLQFHARVMQAVRSTAEAYPGRVVTVVTHGGVLDMLWRTANGLPLDGLRACEIPNTGINRLRWRAGTLEIVQWADAGHLEGMPPQPSTTVARP